MTTVTTHRTPVRTITEETLASRNDFAAPRRRQAWEAYSVGPDGSDDNQWHYVRIEGERSTPWLVIHLPTDSTLGLRHATLIAAREYTADDAWVWPALWSEALWVLTTLRERPDPLIPVTEHDHARAYLTWAVDNGRVPPGH